MEVRIFYMHKTCASAIKVHGHLVVEFFCSIALKWGIENDFIDCCKFAFGILLVFELVRAAILDFWGAL
jgi:hypothetical protein